MIKDGINYLKQVQKEFSKVSWPSFQEFVGSAIVVLILTVFFMVYLGLLDFELVKLAKYIFARFGGY